MATSIRAQINPALLIWAREQCRMDAAYAANKLSISEEKLTDWEAGTAQPTINQLRTVAKTYKINFAALFLPEPPPPFNLPVKDYRLHHGVAGNDLNPEIVIDLRLNLNAREVAVELEEELGESKSKFEHQCQLSDDPALVAKLIRKIVGITFEQQKRFRESRIAFNEWRNAISRAGVLTFQSTKVNLSEMRGYSVFFDTKPLVVVNRKDAYTARTFTLLHEFTHLLLRSSGVCDLHTDTSQNSISQKVEAFCNKVASLALVPDEIFFRYQTLNGVGAEGWSDDILDPIAKDFGVSREVILRKLLDNGRTTQKFYLENRERYSQEAIEFKRRKNAKGGFVTPSVDVVSAKGKEFVALVFDAMHSSIISPNDASDVLGVKAKHFGKIENAIGGES